MLELIYLFVLPPKEIVFFVFYSCASRERGRASSQLVTPHFNDKSQGGASPPTELSPHFNAVVPTKTVLQLYNFTATGSCPSDTHRAQPTAPPSGTPSLRNPSRAPSRHVGGGTEAPGTMTKYRLMARRKRFLYRLGDITVGACPAPPTPPTP